MTSSRAVGVDPQGPKRITELIDGEYDVTVFGRPPEGDVPCPQCKEGQVERRGNPRDGSVFYGCSNWPYCEHRGRPCPKCGTGLPVRSGGDFPATTTVPGGCRTGLTWMVTAGLAMAVAERATLDLACRYTDLGKVRTGRGRGRVIWRDGTRPLDRLPTEARLWDHGMGMSLRYAF